jgi:hypothetical protein
MRQFLLLCTLMVSVVSSTGGQTSEAVRTKEDAALRKLALLIDLQALDAKAAKLDKPLARATARTEIADAAWELERDWAKTLLAEAYRLTFPDEKVAAKLKERPVGVRPTILSPNEHSPLEVRRRIMAVASRDKYFARQLIQTGAEQLGRGEAQSQYANLAFQSIESGDKEAADEYIRKVIDADPTQTIAQEVITELAIRDRAAADALIILFIERLRATPLTSDDGSAARATFMLFQLVFPSSQYPGMNGRAIAPPGPAVMRAYAVFIVEHLRRLEQIRPGRIKGSRILLLTVWPSLKKYAPELIGEFWALEALSRKPDDDPSITPENYWERNKETYEEQRRRNYDDDNPDPMLIDALISRKNFVNARKLIDKLAEGSQKLQLADKADAKEALTFADKGEIAAAIMLAEKLRRAVSILEVYPAIIRKCASRKDQACVSDSTYQALKQLKRVEVSPSIPPAGIPARIVATPQEFDPLLSSLNKLAGAIAPSDETLALEVLDEVVAAANRSTLDTGQGRTGLSIEVFSELARRNETRVRQAAEGFTDPLRQIVILAAVYKSKARELAGSVKGGVTPSTTHPPRS